MDLGPKRVRDTYEYVLNQSGANAITLGNGAAVNWTTAGVPAATTTVAGFMSTVAQTIGGTKTFTNGIISSAGVTGTNLVFNTGAQTIAGVKTFSDTIVGNINGNAATVTNGVTTVGNQNIGGIKAFALRPTVNGTGVLLSGEAGGGAPLTDVVFTTGAQNIIGVKTFTNGIFSNAGVTGTNLVFNTGAQNIGGVKTFNSRPTVNGSGVLLIGDLLLASGPYADDIEAAVAGVPDNGIYSQPSGAVAANIDHLSLDLAFALNKTLVARKGPTPTFTRASTATFIGSNGLIQSAAINEARFDHDPVTLVCRGLLIEEQRRNELLNSDALATQNVTVTDAARTLSFYGTGTVVLSGAHSATVNGTGAFPSRRTLTFTPTAGTLTLTVTGTVRFAQLEIGTFVSSYIPTTTEALTRSSDLCSITGTDLTSSYNLAAGTFFCEHTPTGRSVSGATNIASVGGAQNGIFMIINDNSSLRGFIETDESTKFNSSVGNAAFGVSRKSAMAFQNNGSAIICENGTLGTQSTNEISLLNNVDSFNSLRLFEGLFTTIKSFRYFKTRLSNAKLQTLTYVDPIAAYIAAITSAGATVTAPQQAAISAFISGEIAAGRWDGHKRIYFPVWGVAAANAICMKSLTTGTFIGSINHGAGFARANNNASGMLTNSSLPNIGVTKESWHFTALFYEHVSPDGFVFGRDPNTDFSMFDDWYFDEQYEEDSHVNSRLRVSDRTHFTRSSVWGVFTAFGSASTVNIKNRRSSGVNSVYQNSTGNSTNTVDFVNGTFAIMSIQIAGTTVAASSSKYGAFSFGNTMSDASDTAYTAALKTLWETVTGLTLS